MTEAPTFPRRFYSEVSVRALDQGFAVMLDTRRLVTPGGKAFISPTAALAEACAQEWRAQGDYVAPTSMPLSQLAFVALDHTSQAPQERVRFVASFARTDLCCHRAEAPAELVARQQTLWGPIVAWGEAELGVNLPVVAGIVAADVPDEVVTKVEARAAAYDCFRLTGLAQAAALSGSALIAFALAEGRLDGVSAFKAAALDELWNLERWGEDAEARTRLDQLAREFDAVARFFTTVQEP